MLYTVIENENDAPAWFEFLYFLGEKVQLSGFTGFNGGLDTSEGKGNVLSNGEAVGSGSHSIYTKWNDMEIMFHVSTMLPHTPNDSQQVDRKRFLGNDINSCICLVEKQGNEMKCKAFHFISLFFYQTNEFFTYREDIVNIVFQDHYAPFQPAMLSAAKTRIPRLSLPLILSDIICVVQRIDDDNPTNGTRYRVAFASKNGVTNFVPELPEPAIFEKGEQLRNFLFTKCTRRIYCSYYLGLNGENTAQQSNYLAALFGRERVLMLKNMESQYVKEK